MGGDALHERVLVFAEGPGRDRKVRVREVIEPVGQSGSSQPSSMAANCRTRWWVCFSPFVRTSPSAIPVAVPFLDDPDSSASTE